jgi:hypothetical protein
MTKTNQTMSGKVAVVVSEPVQLRGSLMNSVVSNATLRASDLIVAFRNTLHFGWPSKLEWLNVEFDVSAGTDFEGWAEAHPQDARDLIDELMDSLGEIAPAGCTFASNEGDGACFGFWSYKDPDDMLDEAREVAAEQAAEDPRDDSFDEDKWHAAPEPPEDPPFDDGGPF